MQAKRFLTVVLAITSALGAVASLPAFGQAKGGAASASPVEQEIAAVQRRAMSGPNAAVPMPLDARMVTYGYDPDYDYPILTRPFTGVYIDFGQERIKGLYMSDSSKRWKFKITNDRTGVFVRADLDNILNSGTVRTETRTYQITITSSSSGSYYKRVQWDNHGDTTFEFDDADAASRGTRPSTTPHRPADASDVVDLARANFDYVIQGNAPFKPDMVFDDGRFTWIHLPPGVQEIPALFKLSADGTAELVNFTPRPQRDYFVAQIIFTDGALLKLGKQEVKIFNRRGKSCGFWGCRSSVSNFNTGS